jgi:hypothetical protein
VCAETPAVLAARIREVADKLHREEQAAPALPLLG